LASERIVIGQDYSIEIAKKDGAQLIALTVNRISVSSYGLTTPQGELKQPKQKERRNA
jgi:hypothetical protein